jgi:hypothetical protein
LAATTDATAAQKAEAVRINTEARANSLKASFLILAAVALLAILPAGGLPNYKPEEVPDPNTPAALANGGGAAEKAPERKAGKPAPAA